MIANAIINYRKIVSLKDGANILMRPMTQEDEQALLDLFMPASDEDVRYLRDNVRDPVIVEAWCASIDYAQVLPLVAIVRDRIVGQATLHFRTGHRRHIGEVRIFLAKDFRRRGLGTKMIETLIELARKQDLHTLKAEIVADQSKVIKAFQTIGFELCCTFDDYFMLPDGDTRDVAVLMLSLRNDLNEF